MAIEARDLLRRQLEQLPEDHPERAFINTQIGVFDAYIAARKGVASEPSESSERVDLNAEWKRRAERYIELGFHKELGLSKKDYLASLPKFELQPESFRGRFDIPILVETRIKSQRQAELAGLSYYLSGSAVSDWEGDPMDYKTSDVPYTAWMQDGRKNLKRSVDDVRKALEIDERGATEYDGVALWISNPSVLRDHYIDLPGTQVGSGGAPDLARGLGGPRLDYGWAGNGDPRFGSASCGRV
ncbi:MAG: hypothetical protein M1268_04320 [Patescibacteria group bacterium]|nr:hypothetical protein [Patescibacteria group bacterium]